MAVPTSAWVERLEHDGALRADRVLGDRADGGFLTPLLRTSLWPEDRLDRARARAISSELVSGFRAVRSELSSHLFGRVAAFEPSADARDEIDRVFELLRDSLARSGGPFLFGRFGIADAMYFPMLGRFRTYGVEMPPEIAAYAEAVDAVPAVRALVETARSAPRLALYDRYLRLLGGDPG